MIRSAERNDDPASGLRGPMGLQLPPVSDPSWRPEEHPRYGALINISDACAA
jgi:hypothetical protein